ncbi:MAG: Crp/Fnr family transcriptional regulator [Candidatus Obscuribacterales bacterium]|nr:Crp/Fnr family transcriptional regulator [Candidatus Obscuribacterales bacterium]
MSSILPKNLLLLKLKLPARQAFFKVAEIVHFDLKEALTEPNQSIEFVDFPESGVMSLLQPLSGGALIELANIGYEGMVGLPVAFGVLSIGEKCFCQVEGAAWRVKSENFRTLQKQYPEWTELCQRYAITLIDQLGRNAACNRVHAPEQRCARWLLQTNDRCHNAQFVLTQEFLALMLGVSRTAVNVSAGVLSKAKLISYVRGKVTILDRKGLEAVSCDCYNALTSYYEQVIGLPSESLQ